MQLLIHITARFIIADREGSSFQVKLYDNDLLEDDFLAEQHLKADGVVHFTVNPTEYRTADSPREKKPDFYMVLLKNGTEIFRTPTATNIDLENEGYFDAKDGLELDLGEFLVN